MHLEGVNFDELLKQRSSEVIAIGPKFTEVIEIAGQKIITLTSAQNQKIEEMKGYENYDNINSNDFSKIEKGLDSKNKEYINFSLKYANDDELLALAKKQGIAKEQLSNFKNKEDLIDFLQVFASIDSKNTGKERLYPLSPEEGNRIANNNDSIIRYDVKQYLIANNIINNKNDLKEKLNVSLNKNIEIKNENSMEEYEKGGIGISSPFEKLEKAISGLDKSIIASNNQDYDVAVGKIEKAISGLDKTIENERDNSERNDLNGGGKGYSN